VIFSFVPLVGIIAWPIGITGLILGFVGLARFNRREATNRGVCIGGLITSGAALVICVLWLVGIGIAGSQTAPSRSTIPTVGAAPAAQANPPAAPAKPAGPATSFGDGTYDVGGGRRRRPVQDARPDGRPVQESSPTATRKVRAR
jgi:hypothetical protein